MPKSASRPVLRQAQDEAEPLQTLILTLSFLIPSLSRDEAGR